MIRAARPDDGDAVREIVEKAFEPYCARMDRRPAPMDADYCRLIAEGAVLVAETPDAVGGVVVAFVRDGVGFVETIAVAPGLQGDGWGKRLMVAAEQKLVDERVEMVELYTNEVMTETLPWYLRLGYHHAKTVNEEGYRRVYFRKRLKQTEEA